MAALKPTVAAQLHGQTRFYRVSTYAIFCCHGINWPMAISPSNRKFAHSFTTNFGSCALDAYGELKLKALHKTLKVSCPKQFAISCASSKNSWTVSSAIKRITATGPITLRERGPWA